MDRSLVLPQLLHDRAATCPDRLFFQEVDGVELTYRQLDDQVMLWTDALRRVGIVRGDVVSVMLPNDVNTVITWMAIAWRGALELPVNTSFKGQMLLDVFTAANARLAVVHARYLDRIEEVVGKLPMLERVVVVGATGDLPQLPVPTVRAEEFLADADIATAELEQLESHDTASIVWTSGTTGPSKGTLVSWTQLLAMGTGAFPPEELGEDDALYSPFPMFYVGGKLFMYLTAYVGARLVMKDRFNTARFWDEIRRYGCTTSPLNPATTLFLYKQPRRADDADNPLRNVLLAPLIPEIDDFCQRFGVRVMTVYNSTEISCPIVSTWNPKNRKSCGRIRPGYSVRVVDENDYEVAPGEIGELVVRADEPWKLMTGYWGRPEATVEAWRNLWFHTGDAFTYDADGNYYFVDRIKDAIRRRGQNISSAEVEAAVNEHPAVLESAVVAASSEWGEDEVRVFVALSSEATAPKPEELFAFLCERLPRFMVPRYIDIIDEMPKTTTEKIQKTELRARPIAAQTWDREAAGLKLAYEG